MLLPWETNFGCLRRPGFDCFVDQGADGPRRGHIHRSGPHFHAAGDVVVIAGDRTFELDLATDVLRTLSPAPADMTGTEQFVFIQPRDSRLEPILYDAVTRRTSTVALERRVAMDAAHMVALKRDSADSFALWVQSYGDEGRRNVLINSDGAKSIPGTWTVLRDGEIYELQTDERRVLPYGHGIRQTRLVDEVHRGGDMLAWFGMLRRHVYMTFCDRFGKNCRLEIVLLKASLTDVAQRPPKSPYLISR